MKATPKKANQKSKLEEEKAASSFENYFKAKRPTVVIKGSADRETDTDSAVKALREDGFKRRSTMKD